MFPDPVSADSSSDEVNEPVPVDYCAYDRIPICVCRIELFRCGRGELGGVVGGAILYGSSWGTGTSITPVDPVEVDGLR